MSQTLYRKYRPQTFTEVIGQKHIVQTLVNALKHGRISHAYLFTGPRGTGKTTLARIFAKAVECSDRQAENPCLKCPTCKTIGENRSLDIIEIDAASNTQVDKIRTLIEGVTLPPTQGKYKIYIIDEVHMLSQGSFNALLKTLEEPPAHVIFILATTEIHKVPDTIISRCQRFDFARLSMEHIIQKLSHVAQGEKIKVEKEALEMIAVSAEGGMRDAESLLAQVIALEDKNITAKEVQEILGTTSHQALEKMARLILEKQTARAIEFVGELTRDGYDLEIFAKSLLNYFRQIMIVSVDQSLAKMLSLELTSEQIAALKKLSALAKTEVVLKTIEMLAEAQSKLRSAFIPQLPLEIAIVEATTDIQRAPESLPAPVASAPDQKIPETKKEFVPSPAPAKVVPIDLAKETPKTEAALISKAISLNDVQTAWNNFLNELRPKNHSLSAFLVNCQPVRIENNVLTIAVKYGFYKEKLGEHTNKLTIEDTLANILGAKVRVMFLSEEEAGVKINPQPAFQSTPPATAKEGNSLLSEAMNIFGGKIVE